MNHLIPAAAFLLSATMADAEVYDCKMTSGQMHGYVTDHYFFDYDATKKTVIVLDGAIQHFTGGPLAGTVTGDTAARTTFSWSLNTVNTLGQQARIIYSGAIFKADHAAVISGRVGGGAFVGSWEARGACAVK